MGSDCSELHQKQPALRAAQKQLCLHDAIHLGQPATGYREMRKACSMLLLSTGFRAFLQSEAGRTIPACETARKQTSFLS